MKSLLALSLFTMMFQAFAAPSAQVVTALKKFAKMAGHETSSAAVIAKDKQLLKNGLDSLTYLMTTRKGLRIYFGEIKQNQGTTLVMTTVRDVEVSPRNPDRFFKDFAEDQTTRQALVTKDLLQENIRHEAGRFAGVREYYLENGLLGYQALSNLQIAGQTARLVRTDLVFGQTLTKELDISFFEELASRISSF